MNDLSPITKKKEKLNMLTFVRNLDSYSAQYAIEPLSSAQIDVILQTLQHYIGNTNGTVTQVDLVPPQDESALTNALAAVVPQLESLAEQLKYQLDNHYSVILLTKVWLDAYNTDTRAAVLYALSLFIGSPTPTDKVDRQVVWDIKTLGASMAPGHKPTFSEHDDEAKLHTDTQYYPNPERYMMLYANQTAKCGGGVSSFRDVNSITQALEQSQQGRWALKILSEQALPFRVPMSFTKDGKQGTKEFTYAPVFSDSPKIRYRQDTLKQGFNCHPEQQTEQINQALAILDQELARTEAQTCLLLQPDALLIMNNHECLHGRTAFTDQNRHAFRVRIAQKSNLCADGLN